MGAHIGAIPTIFPCYTLSMGAGKGKTRRARSRLSLRKATPEPSRECLHMGSVNRTSSKGVEARMELYHDADGTIKDGWVVDVVELHTHEGPAGYLKIAFIPQAKLEEHFPTALEWAVREKGKYRSEERR